MLSPRRKEILKLATRGYSNRKIANTLKVSHNTVKNQLATIFEQLEAKDRTHAVCIAIKKGYINLN